MTSERDSRQKGKKLYLQQRFFLRFNLRDPHFHLAINLTNYVTSSGDKSLLT